MKKLLLKCFIKHFGKQLWDMAGNLAERFINKEDDEYDVLQDKMYYWITSEIKDF